MKRAIAFIILALPILVFAESIPLVNLITVEGLQENPVIGYGLVVGLDGSGDSADGSQTKEFISRIADNFGFSTDPEDWNLDNSAVVVVSGNILPGAAVGARFDITVSSLFDATSLEGGRLIITPLIGGDEEVYALAQGDIVIDEDGSPVSGTVSLGGIIQNEIEHTIVSESNEITININEKQGITTISKVSEIIEAGYPGSIISTDNYKMTLKVPDSFDAYGFITELYALSVDVEQEPEILIDLDSGIIIAGGDIIISEAVITFEGTDVSVGSLWGSAGTDSDTAQLFSTTTTVSELAQGLNQIGASSSDIADILQLLYENGNLKAKLTVQ